MPMDNKESIHKGHRERMRRRFIHDGSFDNFQYHEILEIILYYSVKRADTNALAHKMLDSFGSFHALLNASVHEIMSTCNVSENTAFLITMIPHIAKRYMDSMNEDNHIINSKNDAFKLLKPMVLGESKERFFLICLDSAHRVLKIERMEQGSVNHTGIRLERLIELLIKHRAVFAIVAHNHPGRTMKPSADDIAATKRIQMAFEMINVVLLDHIILCGDDCFSFAQNRMCSLQY